MAMCNTAPQEAERRGLDPQVSEFLPVLQDKPATVVCSFAGLRHFRSGNSGLCSILADNTAYVGLFSN